MSSVIDAIFAPKEAKPQIAAPSAVETEAQKTQDEITKAQETKAAREAESRSKIITARTAGPSTLFKREAEIPKAVKLGGGART